MTVAVARHLLGDDKVPARLLRRARRPILSAIAVTCHLDRHPQEVPRDFCAGRGGQQLWPSPSHNISSVTTKSSRGFCAACGGLKSQLSPSPGTTPGVTEKSRTASARGEAANTYGCRRRPASCWRQRSPPARVWQPTLTTVTAAWHLARRRQEVPRDFYAGRGVQHLWPSPLPNISSATTKSPRCFYARRGGLYSPPSPLPGISPRDTKKSRVPSARGEAANTYRRRRRPPSPW